MSFLNASFGHFFSGGIAQSKSERPIGARLTIRLALMSSGYSSLKRWECVTPTPLNNPPAGPKIQKNMCLLLEKTREHRSVHLPRGSRHQCCGSADHPSSPVRQSLQERQGNPDDRPGRENEKRIAIVFEFVEIVAPRDSVPREAAESRSSFQ
jgi:hypothetical protein